MLAAASAKENANPEFCHDIAVWRSRVFSVNRRFGSGGSHRTAAARASLRGKSSQAYYRFLSGSDVSTG